MNVTVMGVNQEVSFDDGTLTNYVTLRLPDGSHVKALVTDDGAAALIRARHQQGGFAVPPAPPAAAARPAPPLPNTTARVQAAPTSEDHDGAVVFGGAPDDGEEDDAAPSAFWPGGPAEDAPETDAPVVAAPDPELSSNDPSAQVRAFQRQQKAQKERAKKGPTMGRTIQKDEYGYPIAPKKAGTADPRDILGGAGGQVDEDGVGQL